ncbi:MAG: aminotransferase class I/II-fold pyridoxal phosphate-dependent enzyme [Firmicutes bacterium]|nr:aminotransferase class I/II-fold pyridoxal phosphate-dependent enzyme [Bacillota bacterium]
MLYKSKNPHGGDIYEGGVRLDYSANTNPMGTPEKVVEAAADSLKYADRYPDPYARELIRSIAAFHGLPEDYVLAGAGAAEMIYSYCQAGKFGKAMIVSPTFAEYELGLRAAGDTEIIYHIIPADDDFSFNSAITFGILKHQPDVVFICNPNNPSGKLADPALIKEIIGVSKKAGVKVFLDECFIDLAEGESMTWFLNEHPNLTILRAFTKTYGMAGLRLGYVLSSDGELLKEMSKCVQPWNISTPAQAAGVQALKEDDFLKESIALIKRERRYLTDGLRELGLRVIDSDVNFLLFKAPEDLGEKMKEEGILIRDCSNYTGLGSGWYRIAVRLHEENEELLRTMKEVLGKE